jgi:hypothetical protein
VRFSAWIFVDPFLDCLRSTYMYLKIKTWGLVSLFQLNGMLLASALLTPSPADASPLSILLSPVTTASAAYDFGKVNQGSTAPLLHKFFLKNANASPVVVERVQVSCGCTTATLGGGAALPDTLAPGKVLEVDTSVDPLRLYAGAVEKSVAVYVAGQAAPGATLTR